MAKWNYEIDGSKLYALIDAGESNLNMIDIIHELFRLCKECASMEPDYANHFEELADLLNGDDDIIRSGDFGYTGFDSAVELVDTRLSEFYSECDWNSIQLRCPIGKKGK